MQTLRTSKSVLAAAVTAIALAAGACDTNLGEPQNAALDQFEAEALAQVMADDIAGLPEAAVYDASLSPPMLAAREGSAAPECFTRSPEPPTNSDTDPVPDSVRLTYAGCTHARSDFTVEINGIVDIFDLNPTVADHSIKWVLTDFTRDVTRVSTGATRTSVENGTRIVAATSSVLEHQLIDFTTAVTFPDGGTALHEKDWATTFTADVEGSIQRRSPLPNGEWVIAGTSTWTYGERSSSLNVSTAEPLHYNAACDVRPKFDAGTLVIVRTRGDRTATVTITYTACGQYTVTRS
jgi:hypothetical protein